MAQLTDGFKDIFLAGIGAMAMTGEKAKEVIDQLIEKGELTVEQGKQVNTELKHKAGEAATNIGTDVLEASMKAMTPEQRAAFAAKVAELAAQPAPDAPEVGDATAVEVDAAAAEPAGDAAPAPGGPTA